MRIIFALALGLGVIVLALLAGLAPGWLLLSTPLWVFYGKGLGWIADRAA